MIKKFTLELINTQSHLMLDITFDDGIEGLLKMEKNQKFIEKKA